MIPGIIVDYISGIVQFSDIWITLGTILYSLAQKSKSTFGTRALANTHC